MISSYFKKNNLIKKLKNSTSFRLLLIFLPTIVFAWPLQGGFLPYPFKIYFQVYENEMVEASEQPKKIDIKGESESLGSKNLFSSIFKINLFSMPVNFCVENKNKIFDGNQEIDYRSLIDNNEAGAMSVKYKMGNSSDEVYTKINSRECKKLPAEGVFADNSVEVRNPLPIRTVVKNSGKEIQVNLENYNNYTVLVYKNFGFTEIIWSWRVFLINFIIFTLGWWLIIESIVSIYRFILKK